MSSPVPNPQPSAGNPPGRSRAPDVFRDGLYLVVRKQGAKLPSGCLVCNAAEARREWLKARKFNLPLAGVVLFASPILILMHLVSPMAKFEAGLCCRALGRGSTPKTICPEIRLAHHCYDRLGDCRGTIWPRNGKRSAPA